MTMIDRVARALCIDFVPDADWDYIKSMPVHPLGDRFTALARKAIAAMREPTDAMIDEAWEHTADPCWRENVADAWRAAIDAALSE